MIATSWTSAGDVVPTAPDDRSPQSAAEPVAAVAAGGWLGLGLVQDDLREVRDSTGFAALRATIADAGLVHTEVELLTDRWTSGADRACPTTSGRCCSTRWSSSVPFVEPPRRLTQEAGERGTRIAIEGMPFSLISSVPLAAELARAVGHPACGR